MNEKEYILNEVGLDIARENLAKKMREIMKNENNNDFKEKLLQLIQDKDEIENGNVEIIKKYMGEINIE